VAEVLVVCTANRGRSPMGEAILRRLLAERGADGSVSVSSAGLCAYEIDRVGLPADPASTAVCADHGLDLGAHVCRAVTRALVEASDLVIVMESWQQAVLNIAYPGTVVRMLSELAGEASDTADIAGEPADVIEAFYQRADHCLRAGLRGGPLADLLATGSSPTAP
jgi:protein-tyrosine phosphatase